MTTFHAQTVGSLQRPAYLMQARQMHAEAKLSASEFKKLEDRAVDEAIALQVAAGLNVITDGEQRRSSFRGWLVEAVNGVSNVPALPVTLRGLAGYRDVVRASPVSVTGRLTLKRSLATEEFAYARGRSSKLLKVTLPSPLIYLIHIGPETSSVYPDPFDMFEDAAKLLQRECQELARLGCEYIQIDAPELTWPGDPLLQQTAFRARGISADRFADEASDLLNIVTDVPGVKFAVHFCRGNHPTHFFSSGNYDAAVKKITRRVHNADTFLLEYDSERAGSFEILRDVPEEKLVVLGLISSMKRAELESVEELVAKIHSAGNYHPKDRLGLSPQCGFCSEAGLQGFDAKIQAMKLERVVQVADRVWGE